MDQYLHYIGGGAGALALTGVAAASALYLANRPSSEKPLFPLDAQCLLEGPELIRVSRFCKDGRDGRFISYLYEDVKTLYEGFRRGTKDSNNGPCLGWRDSYNKPYQWLHYNEALLRAKNFGSGLIAEGLSPGANTFIGIYAQNSPEWVLTEQATYCYSMVLVPLYDTLGPDACAFIIDQAEIKCVVCEDEAKCNLLLDRSPPCLKKIIMFKDIKAATKQRAKNKGIEILRFTDVETVGSKLNHDEVPPQPSDLCTICYTSGTTGNPKGVMLTHENVMASVAAVLMQLGDHRPTTNDILISFLPLAHMLERCCENAMYLVGGSVGFYSGDIRRLSDDMKALRPTVTPAVPRGVIRNNSFWDKLVFKKVQEGMGGRLRLMLVGSAPLAENVLTFVRCALGCLVVEGYGQTECCAPITLTVQGDHVPGHVGPPVGCCCVKLVDVPEMEYWAKNNQGEVCVKGTNVFQGYYKEPKKTRETIDENGWHHTGDVGQWLPVRQE
ncbi:hypothetical protein FQA39_LY19269 [Lamprigera yunnana]|nr:hypothetical protein FQA39_LY19269 [Lamprigera yunnana]